MKIKVKRATTEGIKQNTGFLFEAHGFQFCLIEDKKEGFFRAIELSTGNSSCNLDNDFTSRFTAYDLMRKDILEKNADIFKEVIDKAKLINEKYGFKFPVNKPVKPAVQHAEKLDSNKTKG